MCQLIAVRPIDFWPNDVVSFVPQAVPALSNVCK